MAPVPAWRRAQLPCHPALQQKFNRPGAELGRARLPVRRGEAVKHDRLHAAEPQLARRQQAYRAGAHHHGIDGSLRDCAASADR
ncbi:hypothetical protein GCM10027440_24770 [Nocardiopsis coralliicola]